jgi:hypothetical protein
MGRPFILEGRPFVRGRAECLCCEKDFSYLLPVEVLPFWDSTCSDCSLAMPQEAPVGKQIVIEIKEF